jgi:hypothetical protein
MLMLLKVVESFSKNIIRISTVWKFELWFGSDIGGVDLTDFYV